MFGGARCRRAEEGRGCRALVMRQLGGQAPQVLHTWDMWYCGTYSMASQSNRRAREAGPQRKENDMMQEKMNQIQAIELTDDQLDAVTGGKGRPGGGSLIGDVIRLIRRMIEKNPPSNG